MHDFGKPISHLQALRSKFERLLAAARAKADRSRAAGVHRPARLRELTAFGSNPGNLRMLVHVPGHLSRNAPLVVALHGCGQNADEYDRGTGWSTLADRLGFALVYPEQQPVNNPKNCFSWFVPEDIARDHGEALSIQQMVEHAILTLGADRRRVFVTGLSAGGAMAVVLLAAYPELFAGGAIIAGLPYGAANSVQEALEAMFTEQSLPPAALGDRVRAASQHRGPWPKISVWHGTADPIVKFSNSENIIRQWANVHGFSAVPVYEELIEGHTRRVWHDSSGDAVIEAFSIRGMAHGVPLASTTAGDGCGEPGPFFLETGISSTHHIARSWRLAEGEVETPRAPQMAPEPCQIQVDRRAVVVAGASGGGWNDSEGAWADPNATWSAAQAVDPKLVIAAAFKAAGLPVPDFSNASPGAPSSVAPGPIIAAALKTLRKRTHP